MGDLVFLDEYRIGKEQEELEICDEMHTYASEEVRDMLSLHAYDAEYYGGSHINYLTGNDVATIDPAEAKWIIKQLIQRSDIAKHEEDVQNLINEIFEERDEKDY